MKTIAILSICLISACMMRPQRGNKGAQRGKTSTDTSVYNSTARPSSVASGETALGVLVSAGKDNIKDPDIRLKAYRSLNAPYVRHGVVGYMWKGSNALYNRLQAEGYKIVLNVDYYPQGGGEARPFVTDLVEYRNKLNDILSVLKPEVVVIENEEYNTTYHTGTMQQYVDELKVAIEVAHSKGLKVTNGGLTARVMTLMVWKDYRDRGMNAQADDFARRTMTPELYNDLPDLNRNKFLLKGMQAFDFLINSYRNMDLDYVNFHWYEPIGQRGNMSAINRADRVDMRALGEMVAFLRRKTNKEVMTNEIGQFNDSPGVVEDILNKCVELKIPYAIWYSGDGGPGKAVALTNLDGSLRANGRVFADYMSKYYSK